jgi:hypothetical protein
MLRRNVAWPPSGSDAGPSDGRKRAHDEAEPGSAGPNRATPAHVYYLA